MMPVGRIDAAMTAQAQGCKHELLRKVVAERQVESLPYVLVSLIMSLTDVACCDCRHGMQGSLAHLTLQDIGDLLMSDSP